MINVSQTFIENVKDPEKRKICFMLVNSFDMIFTNSDFVDGITIEEYFCTSEDMTYGDTPSGRLSFSVIGEGIPNDYSFFTSETGNMFNPIFGVEADSTPFTFPAGDRAYVSIEDGSDYSTFEIKDDGLYFNGTGIRSGSYTALLCRESGEMIVIGGTEDLVITFANQVIDTITVNHFNDFVHKKFSGGASWAIIPPNAARVWTDGEIVTYETVSGGWFDCEITNVSKTYIGDLYTFSDLPGIMSRNDNVTYFNYTPEQVVQYLDTVTYPMTMKQFCDTIYPMIPEGLKVDSASSIGSATIYNRFNTMTLASNPFHGRSVSFRQMISWICEATRTVAIESRTGGGIYCIPKWIGSAAVENLEPTNISSSGINLAYRQTLPVRRLVYESVDGSVSEYEYSGTLPDVEKYSTYYINGNPIIQSMDQSTADAYMTGIPQYTPYTFTVINANPAVEVGDMINVYLPTQEDDVYYLTEVPLLHRRLTFPGATFVAEYEATGGYQRQMNEGYDTQNRLAMNTNDIADINSQLPEFLTAATGVTSVNGNHGAVTVSDTKVTQTYASYSGYTYWRPLVIGSSAGSAETFTPSTVTNNTYTFSNLKVQPSTGTIKATTFKGNLTGNVTGNVTGDVTGDVTGTASGNLACCAGAASASGSVAFNLSNGFRGVLVVQGATSGTNGMYMVWVSGSGAITSYDIRVASSVTFANTTGKMTITAPSSTGVQVMWYITNGTASVA